MPRASKLRTSQLIRRNYVSDEPSKKPAADKPEGRQFKAGVAVGIGSAAIVAALLYARSNKPKKK
ncbi:MAG: hypothetical protein AVDCRST_MAG62-262 [uncultured Sphingomonas sp.]|uniref:Uncharacterized protein n=1 Tax=uncultured Sphingomonas sp. TaxID=158754 RepID=A0A6J4SVN4_9SPHN|nr:MAG: hypothetical protein AVDCRST_MAG62-262 [uncultured Sphingomonas sp.]